MILVVVVLLVDKEIWLLDYMAGINCVFKVCFFLLLFFCVLNFFYVLTDEKMCHYF